MGGQAQQPPLREHPAVQQVYEQLLARTGEANPRPRIEPVRRLAELAGSPQLDMRLVHVAGTNGKTTTSRAIESLLRTHGLYTGLFTSPHLVSFTERIQVGGLPVAPEVLAEAWQELQLPLRTADEELAAAGQGPITFFEALAVLALRVFSNEAVDVAVIEVGMGGEWDATNIIHADTLVFTPIALDHTAHLGGTIAEIARTKAGIIKGGERVFSAVQPPEAERVLRERAEELSATISVAGSDFELTGDTLAVGGREIRLRGLAGTEYEPVFLPLHGDYQAANVSLAVAAAEHILREGEALSGELLEEALGSLTSPGRLQQIGRQPTTLIDAAHNPHGARALARAVTESFNFSELALVFGSFADKATREVAAELLPLAARVWPVTVDSPRALSAAELRELLQEVAASLPGGARPSIAPAPGSASSAGPVDELAQALSEAREWAASAPGRGVLVAGSVVLAGEALALAHSSEWGTV